MKSSVSGKTVEWYIQICLESVKAALNAKELTVEAARQCA